jgi:hypothetical protein
MTEVSMSGLPDGNERAGVVGRYVHNNGLFTSSCFERLINTAHFPATRRPPHKELAEKLRRLAALWEQNRVRYVIDKERVGRKGERDWVGLPGHLCPVDSITSESDTEQVLVRGVVEEILGYRVANNTTLDVLGENVSELNLPSEHQRPDMILFADIDGLSSAMVRFASTPPRESRGRRFCKDALFILDAKRFSKGVGQREASALDPASRKKARQEKTAGQDIEQVQRYLFGYDKTWGILTNGRSWRLMQRGRSGVHLRFDLVLLLEDLRARNGQVSETDLVVFDLFWQLFGKAAVGGGILDALCVEGEKESASVREILRGNAYRAVLAVANGFWRNPDNGYPTVLSQAEADHLRELSLTFLYRLLFVLKAEAQNLLPMRDEWGNSTAFAKSLSTESVFKQLRETEGAIRAQVSKHFGGLRELFECIDRGSAAYQVPAYNGGLFDPEQHVELSRLRMLDESLFEVLRSLIFIDEQTEHPVPYRDLDVRDLGDIYEGLLELRLVPSTTDGKPDLKLTNQKGERKASGSYFTPDSLVGAMVRKTLMPLLQACGGDALKVLNLKVVDPAMGSGHFLVKAVNVMAGYLTTHCDPVDEGAPTDDGPEEFAYWKAKVAENCIYGVDYNPMAVELAKVALWLHTARRDRPLSFLDHHLKLGNSLVGAPLSRLHEVGLRVESRSGKTAWKPLAVLTDERDILEPAAAHVHRVRGPALLLQMGRSLWTGIIRDIRRILARPSDRPADVKAKRKEYQEQVQGKLEAHRLLADLWCAQWFLIEPEPEGHEVYGPGGLYAQLRNICGMEDDERRAGALADLKRHAVLQRIVAAREVGYGPRPGAFFHWELEFPEVAFDEEGRPKHGFGFDAVVGNPPWDKIKPEKRQFYAPFSDDIQNAQGAGLEGLIETLEKASPDLVRQWAEYERRIERFTFFLSKSETYRHQTAVVAKKKTGGDPDLFRYFVERALRCGREGGRVGLVVPATLWQGEGCTGLRRLLFRRTTVEDLHVFENYRKWAFGIDSRFKFTVFVAQMNAPDAGHRLAGSFMIRDPRVLEGLLPERIVRLSADDITALSSETLALLDFKSDEEARLVLELHRKFPPLGSPASGWHVTYRREVDMTNDAWMFKSREWMKSRGFTQVLPVRDEDGTWRQVRQHTPSGVRQPDDLPAGGEYWVAPGAEYYRDEFRRNAYEEREVQAGGRQRVCFVAKEDLRTAGARGARRDEEHFRIFPASLYVPLYEGRMVHNFDHAQKCYLSGQGRKAVWRELSVDEKRIGPRMFVSELEADVPDAARIGFCDVTGATNERTTLAALIPGRCGAGNKVPTLTFPPGDMPLDHCAARLLSLLNSTVWDWLARQRVSTTMNYVYVRQIPVPSRQAAVGGASLNRIVLSGDYT